MNTISTDLPNEVTQTVADLIAAARARAITQRAEAADADSWQREVLAEQEADRLQQDLKILVSYVPAWAHEYFEQRTTDVDEYTCDVRRALNLPGCSQIGLFYHRDGVSNISVVEPKSIYFAKEWRLGREEHFVHTFEEAVDMAASWGESWHAMTTEMARRNLLGLRPEPPAPPPPDNVDKAGDLLAQYTKGMAITKRNNDADGIAVVAAAIYALADQARRIADILEDK